MATLIKNRSASLTEFESGKASATSGAKRTVTSSAIFRPGPRATTRIERKSYSERSSSPDSRLDFFFIDFSFFSGRSSSANNPNQVRPFRVGYYKQTPLIGLSHNNIPFFSRVSRKHRTPTVAIWVSVVLVAISCIYAPAFLVLATGCAVFLYISYVMPVAAGLLAEGKTWMNKGPFNLGALPQAARKVRINSQ